MSLYRFDEACQYAERRGAYRYKYVRYNYNGDKEDLQQAGLVGLCELIKNLEDRDKIPEDQMIKAVDLAISREVRANPKYEEFETVDDDEHGGKVQVHPVQIERNGVSPEVAEELKKFRWEIQKVTGYKGEILWRKRYLHQTDEEIIAAFKRKREHERRELTPNAIEYAVRDAIEKIRVGLPPELVELMIFLDHE